jgi:hypothetical protein
MADASPPKHPPCERCGHRHAAQLEQLIAAEKKNVHLTAELGALRLELRAKEIELQAARNELDALKGTHRAT